MKYSNITSDNTEFVLISFEGPDCYSMAGGLGVRMQNLSRTLAEMGFTTHLFFIGDPHCLRKRDWWKASYSARWGRGLALTSGWGI
jgi:hypothetical protein